MLQHLHWSLQQQRLFITCRRSFIFLVFFCGFLKAAWNSSLNPTCLFIMQSMKSMEDWLKTPSVGRLEKMNKWDFQVEMGVMQLPRKADQWLGKKYINILVNCDLHKEIGLSFLLAKQRRLTSLTSPKQWLSSAAVIILKKKKLRSQKRRMKKKSSPGPCCRGESPSSIH